MGNQQRSFVFKYKERSTTRARARTLQVYNGSGNVRDPSIKGLRYSLCLNES